MNMAECVKMLVRLNGFTDRQIGKWKGVSQQRVNYMLNSDDMSASTAVDILELLGYEVIVREKRPGLRREDEILISLDEIDVTPERLKLLRELELERLAKEEYYEKKDRELLEKYPNGMRVTDLKNYFGKQHPWVIRYFGNYFFQRRVPIKEVMRIMRENNL